jgi:hypothetical protein
MLFIIETIQIRLTGALLVAETPESVPSVAIAAPQVTMSVPPKPVSRSVERNQTLQGSVEKPLQNHDHSSTESVVTTSSEELEIGDDDEKVVFWRLLCQWQHETAFSFETKMG